ncbi:HAD family hydrolase [Acetonema longum]|uniref:Haloacid dehalogenase domain protein hydrolase n=1 Tax=Acetonema longum DSM 6540 TaxID=1009370 RepID=F7NFY8_9FIRM|nr:HAD family hydrolase [Acetonema longum]EGO65051.1 Haloacid dehalogenase domain protein hydrolase [Acetonema longum DSM 6540]
MKILFWDIDGTLLRTAKAGLYAFEQAAGDLYSVKVDLSAIPTAGRTDNYIACEIIKAATGREPAETAVRQLVAHYESLLPGYLVKHPGHLLPSVPETLAHFRGCPDCLTLLLTGNTQNGAQAKLRHYEIDQFFDFQLSAFAGHYVYRNDIARQALAGLKGRLPDINPGRIYVIGDTPHDIECGKAIGARTIAVATGRFSRDELAACHPWKSLEKLPGADQFASMIEGR